MPIPEGIDPMGIAAAWIARFLAFLPQFNGCPNPSFLENQRRFSCRIFSII